MVEACWSSGNHNARTRVAATRNNTSARSYPRREPFIVVVADELAPHRVYVTDRDLKSGRTPPFSSFCLRGERSVCQWLVPCKTRARRSRPSAIPIPTRIALRLAEDEQIDMVLGAGARKRGAMCDQISTAMAGARYMTIPGKPDPIRGGPHSSQIPEIVRNGLGRIGPWSPGNQQRVSDMQTTNQRPGSRAQRARMPRTTDLIQTWRLRIASASVRSYGSDST